MKNLYPVVRTDGVECTIYECETLEQAKDLVWQLYQKELNEKYVDDGNINNEQTNAWVSFHGGDYMTTILIGEYDEIPNKKYYIEQDINDMIILMQYDMLMFREHKKDKYFSEFRSERPLKYHPGYNLLIWGEIDKDNKKVFRVSVSKPDEAEYNLHETLTNTDNPKELTECICEVIRQFNKSL